MFFRAVTTPLMTPVPNFNKWCAVSNFLFKNIDFCIFTPKTPLVKENYFLTLWNFTYLKDTSFGKKLCNFELGLETKNEFEKWPLYNFVSVYTQQKKLRKTCSSAYYNKSSKGLEIHTLDWYKVSFNLSNEALFELIAPGVAWKIIVKVD